MRRHFAVFALVVLAFLAVQATGQDGSSEAESATEPSTGSDTGSDTASAASDTATATSPRTTGVSPATIERGRYLVEGVGMCGECHTPRNEKGELIMGRWLQGAPVPLEGPGSWKQTWAHKAPRIANLPQHTDRELVTLLTTGVNRDGKETLAPMPPFRMSEEDALAIAAYLRSL